MSERFLVFPADLFELVLKGLLPELKACRQKRQQRPVLPAIRVAQQQFDRIWAADGSTLAALFRKLKVPEDVPIGQLAGKICSVIDLTTRLPVKIRFSERAGAYDTAFVADLLTVVPKKHSLFRTEAFTILSSLRSRFNKGRTSSPGSKVMPKSR